MQDKHTPGPWEAMGTLVRSPMHQPEGLPRGVQIAECWDGYFLPHTPEARANARLIAAAPEQHELLQTFTEWARQLAARDDLPKGIRSAAANLHDDGKRLLAKATGSTI